MSIEFGYYKQKDGKSLNRCYRTIYTLVGNTTIHLIDCSEISGNLFSAKDKLTVKRYNALDEFMQRNQHKRIVFFEVNGKKSFEEFYPDDNMIIVIGGKSVTLPKYHDSYRIITKNKLCLIDCVVTALVGYKYAERNVSASL